MLVQQDNKAADAIDNTPTHAGPHNKKDKK